MYMYVRAYIARGLNNDHRPFRFEVGYKVGFSVFEGSTNVPNLRVCRVSVLGIRGMVLGKYLVFGSVAAPLSDNFLL